MAAINALMMLVEAFGSELDPIAMHILSARLAAAKNASFVPIDLLNSLGRS
jgi:hypothetical protein